MKLLITEKPSVAVEFAKALNLNINVINSSKSKGFIEGRLMPRIVEYRWHR